MFALVFFVNYRDMWVVTLLDVVYIPKILTASGNVIVIAVYHDLLPVIAIYHSNGNNKKRFSDWL